MNILTFFHLCDNESYVPRGLARTQSASLVIHTLLSLESSQVFGSQEKMDASLRGKFISKFTIQISPIIMV